MILHINEIYKIINRYDPVQLLMQGCPIDEYYLEAHLIYSMWNDSLSFDEFVTKVYQIFYESFKGILDRSRSFFVPMSKEIWSYLKMNESV